MPGPKSGGPSVTSPRKVPFIGLLVLCAALFFGETAYYLDATGFVESTRGFVRTVPGSDGWQGFRIAVLWSSYYPPIYSFLLYAFASALAGNAFLIALANAGLVFLGGVLAALVLQRKYGSLYSAYALLLFVLTPAVVVFSKAEAFENALVPMIGLSFWLLARSHGFRSRGFSLLLGIALGLGMLTKWTFPAYVAGPFVLGLADSFDPSGGEFRRADGRRITHAALALVMGLLTCAPWYLGFFDAVAWSKTAPNDPSFPHYGFFQNLSRNCDYLYYLAGKPALLVSMILVALSPDRLRLGALAAAGMGLPLLIFSVPPHIEDRYIYPLVVFWTVLVFLSCGGFRKRWQRVAAVTMVLVPAVFAHVDSYRGQDLRALAPGLEMGYATRRNAALLWGRRKGDAVLRVIADDAATTRKSPGSAAVAVHPFFLDYHLNQEYLAGLTQTDPAFRRLAVRFQEPYLYPRFSDGLRGGLFDYVVLDCGPTRDCRDFDDTVIRETAARVREGFYYLSGGPVPGFDPGLIYSDLEALVSRYDRFAEIALEDRQVVQVYRKR
jgi:hypothetical protein